jgi:signal transduction histidine kinase
MLAVPLTLYDRVLGVIIVIADRGNPDYTLADQDLLVALAKYAAVAIENAQLYQRTLNRSSELALLVESANAISSPLDFDQVLNGIARYSMRALQAHWCMLSRWTPSTKVVTRLAEYRSAVWESDGPTVSLAEMPVYRQALSSSKPAVFYFESTHSTSTKSSDFSRMLIVPIQSHGQIVGLADLRSISNTERFASADIGRCLRKAMQLAPLLSARSSGNVERIRQLVIQLTQTANADWCTILTWSDSSEELSTLAAYGTGIWMETSGPQIEINDSPTMKIVLEEQRIAVISSEQTQESHLFDPTGASTMVVLPLVFGTQSIGLVQLYDLNPRRVFSRRELSLARAFANQAAVALENARLVQNLQRSVDELKAMQGHLVRAARLTALGELSAVVAHQINNPLTTILGDAEILVQDLPGSSPQHESARAILRAGQRAKKVVQRILTVARGDDEARSLDVNQSLKESLELVGSQIEEQGIDLTLDLAPTLPPMVASPGQIIDLWTNLLINARDAIVLKHAARGRILVRTHNNHQHQMIEISIEDNGVGIPRDQLEKVFDPVFTTKPQGEGTGLGLYICQQIVSDHRGEIQITSKPGEGTTVTVLFPYDVA